MPTATVERAEKRKEALEKREQIAHYVRRGFTSGEIALQMAPNDPRKAKVIRGLARRMIAKSEEYSARKFAEAQGILIESLPQATAALAKRAARGRPDAIKLLFEASGFHNPKVKHEHSGDIEIHLSMPRPARVDNPALASGPEPEVVDADVVEE